MLDLTENKKVYLTILEDPLCPEKRQRIVHNFIVGKPLSEYIPLIQAENIALAINGVKVDGPWNEIYPAPEDRIAVASKHGWAAAAYFATWLTGSTWAAAAGWTAVAWAASAVVAFAAISYGLSTVVSLLMTPDNPDGGEAGGGGSPTYGWGTLQNLQNQGNPIPIIIGSNRMAGQIINQYLLTLGDNKNYLNYLIALGVGPVDSIESLEVNGDPYDFFSEVSVYTRLGTVNDTEIEGFNQIYVNHHYNYRLTDQWVTIQTDSNTVEKIELDLFAPQLFIMDKGGIRPITINYSIEIKPSSSEVWNDPGVYSSKFKLGDDVHSTYLSRVPMTNRSPKAKEQLAWIVDYIYPAYTSNEDLRRFDTILGHRSGNRSMWKEGLFTWEIGNEQILLSAQYYSSIVPGSYTATGEDVPYSQLQVKIVERGYNDTVAEAHSVGAEVKVRNVGDLFLKGNTSSPVHKTISLDFLPPNQYDVRIKRDKNEETKVAYADSLYFSDMREVLKYKLLYPGIAKYAVKALATDQLSGSLPSLTVLVTKGTIQVYNPYTANWDTRSFANPAWAVYGVLNTYGNVSEDLIIYDDFKAWADYCDELIDGEKRHVVHTVIDTEGNLWDKCQGIAKYGRGSVFRKGTKISVFVDKEETVVDHLFTMGNIVEGSFVQQFLPMEDRANYIELTYTDPDKYYSRQIVAGYSSEYIDTNRVINRASISYEAAIPRNQVVRDVNYRLNSNKYLLKGVEFDVDIEAFTCLIGDLFYFQHDIPNYLVGSSGRIVSAYNSGGKGYVTLDQEVTLLPGDTYKVMVRRTNDSLIEKTVAAVLVSTTSSTLELTTVWANVPSKYDPFAFGETSAYLETYRITNIIKEQDQMNKITGLIYDARIYSDINAITDDEILPDVLQEALNVKAKEYFVFAGDGNYRSNVMVTWSPSYRATGTTWGIWIQDITNDRIFESIPGETIFSSDESAGFVNDRELNSVVLVGYTDSFHMNIESSFLVMNHEYRIIVSPKRRGYADTISNSTTIKILGSGLVPDSVGYFNGTWDAITRVVHFSWGMVENIDLKYYEIRQGASWETATVVIERATGTRVDLYIEGRVHENRTYCIKTVNYSGNYSSGAFFTTVTIDTSYCALQIPTGLALTTSNALQSNGTDISVLKASWNTNAEISDYWHHYELELKRVDTGDIRTNYTKGNAFFWQVISNLTYSVRVRAYDLSGNYTDWCDAVSIVSALDLTPPSVPTEFTVTGGFRLIWLNWTNPTDDDFDVVEIYRNDINDSGTAAKINETRSDYFIDADITPGDTKYYWLKARDYSKNTSDFSEVKSGSAGYLSPTDINDFAITASKIYTKIPILDGDSWTDNSPAAGSIAWNTHLLYYNGVAYTITASDTALKYVYWTQGSSFYTKSNVNPTLGDGDFIIAVNVSGTHDLAWNAIANEVIGSAYIQNAAITNAKIADLAVDTAKIANLAVTNAKINSLDVSKLNAGTITSKDIVLALTPGGGDVRIRSGKTDFGNTTAGFILGIDDSDSDKAKFEMGDASHYIMMSNGVITLSDNLIITNYVADDNITRLWSYSSGTNVNIPEFGTTPEGIVIAYTEPFIPEVGPDLLLSGYMEYLFSTMADPDIIRFLVKLYDAIDIVLAGSCKWTQFGATSEYYLTNMAGDGVPFGLTSAFCDRVFRDATSGGGIIMGEGTFGSLAEGEWVWSDGGGVLAFSTIFVRLFGSGDPDIYDDGQLRVGNLLQQFYSPFYTFYMDYAGDGMMVQTIEDEVTPTNTYKRSYILTCVEADCAGGLGSRVCYQDRVSFNVLERKK